MYQCNPFFDFFSHWKNLLKLLCNGRGIRRREKKLNKTAQKKLYPILQCLLSFLYLIIKIVPVACTNPFDPAITSNSTPLLPLLLLLWTTNFFSFLYFLFNNFICLWNLFFNIFCIISSYNFFSAPFIALPTTVRFSWMKGEINSQREFRKNYCKFDADKKNYVINFVKNELAEKCRMVVVFYIRSFLLFFIQPLSAASYLIRVSNFEQFLVCILQNR